MRRPLSVEVATLFGLGFRVWRKGGELGSGAGTAGSAAACLVSALVPVPWWGVLLVSLIGLWASAGASRALGSADPACVIIDEVAGMWLSLLLLPPSFILPGFFLFRIVDILKPFPVSAAERLPGGVGIMADDLVGGAMVNLFLQALNGCFLRSGWLYGLVAGPGR